MRALLTVLALLPALAWGADPPAVDLNTAAEHLGAAVRFPTVSYEDPSRIDLSAFQGLHAWMADTYPRVNAMLQREPIGERALLYTWTGSDPSLPPLLLLAHLDVVPVEAGTEKDWPHPPFSGEIAEGAVWGRGTLDDKVAAVSILEASEALLASGFQPKRTILFAFGGDEELGGTEGARKMAALLAERGVKPLLVLDEGMVLTDGLVPGVKQRVALIGVAERGYMTVELVAHAKGGHSSMPPPSTALGELSAAIVALEAHPMEAKLDGPTRAMFEALAPSTTGAYHVLFSNLWLFKGLLRGVLEGKPSTNATVRTTAAVTMAEGSQKENALPIAARALVNYRINPRDTAEEVLAHVREVIDNPNIDVRRNPTSDFKEPTPVSPQSGAAWDLLTGSIRSVFPDAAVAPALMVGTADAARYVGLTENVYRFLPIQMNSKDLERLHGTAERITLVNLGEIVKFYTVFLRDGAG